MHIFCSKTEQTQKRLQKDLQTFFLIQKINEINISMNKKKNK